MQPTNTLNYRSKAVVMNAAIVAGLFVQYWRGYPLFILLVSGIFILVLANLLMMFAAKKPTVQSNR